MKVRPLLTIETVFRWHEKIERDHPPGSEQRGALLEQAHQLWVRWAALVRQLRQIPDDGYFAKLKPLAEMVLLDARTMEKLSFRDLAREVLGPKAATDSVAGLARTYGKRLRDYPGLDQGAGHRFDGLHREYAVRTALENALAQAIKSVTKG